jgi:glycosyltransferase involved in cell wall biosynthesis
VKVSVVVPVRNEEQTLTRLLDSLVAQSVPPDEIVLVDGGSTDATPALARAYLGRGVRVLEIGPAYPGRGRNAAIRATRNDWVAFIDAGCVADPAWLENLLGSREHMDAEPGVIYGECIPLLTDEWDVAQALAFVGFSGPQSPLPPPSIVSSLLHRTVWERVGGFPEHLRAAEDLLFMKWLDDLHVPATRAPNAVVHWRLPRGPMGVWRRFRLYSAHHLAAGLYRTWHLRVMSMDFLALITACVAMLWPPATLLLASGGLVRLLRTVWKRRFNIPDRRAFRADRLLRVALLLLLADVATWVGALDFALGREPPR